MDPIIGEIKLFPYGIVPTGWALCDGRSLPIEGNQTLFSLLGYTFGGYGTTSFNLPDLQGRVPVHPIYNPAPVNGNSIPSQYGKKNGAETVTLNISQLPTHSHQVSGENSNGNSGSPIGGSTSLWSLPADTKGALPSVMPFSATITNAQMDASAISNTGGGLGHNNMQPFLVLSFCIAVNGVYPQRDETRQDL